jgi:hypothetical protein
VELAKGSDLERALALLVTQRQLEDQASNCHRADPFVSTNGARRSGHHLACQAGG